MSKCKYLKKINQSLSDDSQCSFRSRILLEHGGGLGVLAEEASKVEICGHELLLHLLQRPLVFYDLQRLPLTLAQTEGV